MSLFPPSDPVAQTGKSTGTQCVYRLVDDVPNFEEVLGPWNKHAKAIQLSAVDWNQDGRDDLIVMHRRNWTMFFEQRRAAPSKRLNIIEVIGTTECNRPE